MPFQVGGVSLHDDYQHYGSAKRDVVDGVAGLDATGDVLALGDSIRLARSGTQNIYLYERTSGELAVYCNRNAANDYIMLIVTATGQHIVQHAGLKDVISGIAGLDAGGAVLAPGSELKLTRDGSENIEVVERTSGDIVYRWTRIGANDYECRINCGGVACKILNDSFINAVSGIAGLDASGQIVESVIPGILEYYAISDDLLHSHDASNISSSAVYVLVKTITISNLYPTPSTLRLKFDIRSTFSGAPVHGRIYKNSVAHGTERSTTGTSYVTFSEDLSFADGDTIELWVHTAGTYDVSYINFRVYGKKTQTLAEAITRTDVGEASGFTGVNS